MSDESDRYPVEAPGWAAIDAALGRVHPGQVPHQFTSQTAYDLDSRSPLPAIGVYEGHAPEHWHYVSYGLTELFEKSSPRADISGFGFEVSLRLLRDTEAPPTWPLQLIQGVGHYVLSGHGDLDTGHLIDLGGPLVPEDGSRVLEGLMCIPDPMLAKIATPHGSVLFLQLLGLARAELDAMQAWDLERKIGLVRELAPLGIIEPQRQSWTDDPRFAPVFRRYALNVMV